LKYISLFLLLLFSTCSEKKAKEINSNGDGAGRYEKEAQYNLIQNFMEKK